LNTSLTLFAPSLPLKYHRFFSIHPVFIRLL